MKLIFSIFVLLIVLSSSIAQNPKPNASSESKDTYSDIKKTFGIVPEFLKMYPPSAIKGAWLELKGMHFDKATSIPNKYKELVALAVAARIPCKNCMYLHSKLAKFHGASKLEIQEAMAISGQSVKRPPLDIIYTDEQFKREMDVIRHHLLNKRNIQAQEAPISSPPTSYQFAYQDMITSLGIVPEFFKIYPRKGIYGAWLDFKAIELNPDLEIPQKYKNVIGMVTSTQSPDLWLFYYRMMSDVSGATIAERAEASAIAGVVRQWSTFLNSSDLDESKFKNEVDNLIKHMKKNKGRFTSVSR